MKHKSKPDKNRLKMRILGQMLNRIRLILKKFEALQKK